MIYYAHTKENEPESKWQLLKDHLLQTSEIAASFSGNEIYSDVFRIAGLLHDFGKYQPAFQKYLREGGRRGSVPHASWGAGYSLILKQQEISFAIDGHHKGLPDKVVWKNDVTSYIKGGEPGFDKVIETYQNDTHKVNNEIIPIIPKFKDIFECELFTRYMFSSLTDADWLDTEKFCNLELSEKRKHQILDCDELINKLESAINIKSKTGKLNVLRNRVREFAISKSSMSTGFYSMNLPTGMGKTLASVSWGLRHAKENKLKRIIIVLPFVNIIDQTASILKEIFGEEYVLEHHSGISDDINMTENINDNQYDRRLACENWDYPVIITTTVQFFESIFSNRTSKCRKIHNIAESVVIFDEVQTLPKEIIIPTLTMLKNMQSLMNTSFLFCTATLPAFEKRDRFNGIDSIIPLVENIEELFNKTRRVTYHSINGYDPVDFDDLIHIVEEQNCSILAVFNTKKSARDFFSYAKEVHSWGKCYHLSTGMCPVHRKQIIKDIRKDLDDKKKIFVSSTQLIEAGVDFDFPCVFREIAPLESIIQSAGRCNREDKMSEFGNVFLFSLSNAVMPGKLYKTSASFALDMIKENPESIYKHDFYPAYYKNIINLFVDGDAKKINNARENFNFETVSNIYRIIEKATKGLFIFNYSDDSKKLLDSIKFKKLLSRDDYRMMQVYTVQVYDNFVFNNKNSIEETSHGVMVWYGGYDNATGIMIDPMSSDEFVV
jgi:CRISPR-associated endonuclease/helicase Cas3